MNIQSLIQVVKNLKKMFPVFIVIFLSYITLSFIASNMWGPFVRSSQPFLSLDHSNVYQIGLAWQDETSKDSLQLLSIKKQLLEEVKRQPEFLSLTYSPASLIEREWNTPVMEQFGEFMVVHVGENFSELFDIKPLEGRGFNHNDLLHPSPAAIIFKSLAEQENIKSPDEETFLTLKRLKMRDKEESEKKFRVVGVIEDISFLDEYDRYQSIIFIYQKEPKYLLKSENLYVKTAGEIPREKVINILSGVVEMEELNKHVSIQEARSSAYILNNNFMSFLRVYKIFNAIIGVLIIFVGATIFGVFYRFVLNRRDEFAIRRSFGCTQWSIYRKVMFEALLYTLPGAIIGVIFFINIAILLDFNSIMAATIVPALLILSVVFIAVFIPALHISRQTPVEAFHDE